jgi:uncharacterized membrane protein HdeD (DUF308 family)
MDNKIKTFKFENILSAIMYVIIGLLLMLFPDSIAKSICYAIAVVIIVIGIIKIISFLMKDAQEGFARTGLVSGILFIIAGIFVIIRAKVIISIIPFVLGILILFSGISKLQNALQLRNYTRDNNDAMLVAAAVNIILGIILAFNPFRAAKFMLVILGICMVLTGLSDIIGGIYSYKKVKEYVQDMEALEQDYIEK